MGGGGAGAAPTPEFGAKSIITARKRKLEQGNIFAPVCHSVHRGLSVPGGCLPAPGGGGVCSWEELGPRGVLGADPPPGTATAAGGTHPTGMHSCLARLLRKTA